MNTLPNDILGLSDRFLDHQQRIYLSLYFDAIQKPQRCNNFIEAVLTNNWSYIRTYGVSPSSGGKIILMINRGVRQTHSYWIPNWKIVNARKYIEEFQMDPSYGPPFSLLEFDFIGLADNITKEQYLLGCKSTFKEAQNPITLPLVVHTPFTYVNTGGNCYTQVFNPVVGSICSIHRKKPQGSWVVVKVKKDKMYLSKITFISSTTVSYDGNADLVEYKLYRPSYEWAKSDKDRKKENILFDRYIFDN